MQLIKEKVKEPPETDEEQSQIEKGFEANQYIDR